MPTAQRAMLSAVLSTTLPRPTAPRSRPALPLPVVLLLLAPHLAGASGCRQITCLSRSCDHWLARGWSCAVLEAQYGCDCSGCDCNDQAPMQAPRLPAPGEHTARGRQLSGCLNTCPGAPSWGSDGYCDDGGPGAEYSGCDLVVSGDGLGTDCYDCGPRSVFSDPSPSPPPPPSPSPPPPRPLPRARPRLHRRRRPIHPADCTAASQCAAPPS